MIKRLFLFIGLVSPFLGNAQLFRSSNYWRQFRHEMSLGLGASNTLSELGGRDQSGTNFIYDMELSQTKYVVGLNYRYFVKKNFAIRGNFLYAQVSGDDRLTNDFARQGRNLSFQSPIVELSALAEFHPITEAAGHKSKLKGARGKKNFPIGVYAFAGIGGFYYNPRIKGTNIKLRPLHTEGQGLPGGPKQYKAFAIAFPSGMGLRYSVNTKIRIGLEAGYRFTTTDYLDDVSGDYYPEAELIAAYGQASADAADPSTVFDFSHGGHQRGDPTDKDGYGFLQLQFHYKITKKAAYGKGSRIRRKGSMPSF